MLSHVDDFHLLLVLGQHHLDALVARAHPASRIEVLEAFEIGCTPVYMHI